jgi:hypothetical protein
MTKMSPSAFKKAMLVRKRLYSHSLYHSVGDSKFLDNVQKQGFITPSQSDCVIRVSQRLNTADTWKVSTKKKYHNTDNFESFDYGFGYYSD